MSENKVYYKRLDILRIVLCILILLYHLNIVQGGFLAVCSFFALSGYLSCASALKSKEFSIKKYYLNRVKKVYLPLLIVVLSTIILAKTIPNIRWLNIKPESMSVIFSYNNFWQLNANLDYFTRHINSPFMHFWFIAILIQFELIFPLAFVLLQKIDKKINKHLSTLVVILLAIITTLVFAHMSNTQEIMKVYYSTFARSFSIMYGVLLAIFHYKYKLKIIRTIKNHSEVPYIIYILLLVLMCLFATTEHYAISMIIVTVLSLRIIEYSKIRSSGKSNVLEFISKSTYEVYLVQYPVMFFMSYTQFSEISKILLTILITMIISFSIHFLLNNKNNAIRIISVFIFGAILLCGRYVTYKRSRSHSGNERTRAKTK